MSEEQNNKNMTKRGFWSWTLGIPAAIAGLLSALNIIFDVQIRPTWSWEHNILIEEVIDLRAEFAIIKADQVRIEIYQIESIISDYENRKEEPPRYLTDRLKELNLRLDQLR